jgi:hypothetical protein
MKRLLIICLMAFGPFVAAQNRAGTLPPGEDSWQVTVNAMNPERQSIIDEALWEYQLKRGERSVMSAMLVAAGQAAVSGIIDIAATEMVRLVNLKKTQQREWQQMIERENHYTDSLSTVNVLNDFYSAGSRYGALDPSHLNFDGITIRGVRGGEEVLYLSCHIDEERLEHIFNHSKFYLVVDTIAFYPYNCHLPNLAANGIRVSPGAPGGRNNSFSYDERENLRIGMDLVLSSSWITEDVTVQKDVELGRFGLQLGIPAGTEVYKYSRKEIFRNRERHQGDTTFVNLSGDSFMVPRSYMPSSGTDKMWGTGAYSIKVRLSESCQFSRDPERNAKMKNWKDDYRQLQKMKKESQKTPGYFQTLWQQNGNVMMKSVLKSGMTGGAAEAGLVKKTAATTATR